MSKKDRRNKDTKKEFREDFDESVFDEMTDSFSSKLMEVTADFERATAFPADEDEDDAEPVQPAPAPAPVRERPVVNSTPKPQTVAKIEPTTAPAAPEKTQTPDPAVPLVDDEVEDEDETEKGPGIFERIKPVLAYLSPMKAVALICLGFGTCFAAIKNFGSKIPGYCAAIGTPVIGILKRCGSIFVLKQSESEETDEQATEGEQAPVAAQAETNNAEKVSAEQTGAKKQAAKESASEEQIKSNENEAQAEDADEYDDEDDEESAFKFSSLAWKGTAAAVVLLVGIGGFFGIRSVLTPKDTVTQNAEAEPTADTEQTGKQDSPADQTAASNQTAASENQPKVESPSKKNKKSTESPALG